MTPAEKAREARWNYAKRSDQEHSWDASYDALDAVAKGTRVRGDIFLSPTREIDAWPISGDDLALAKAGRIA